MTGPASSDPAAGGDYDHMPYPSMPFTDTQPAHLAALARLFGIAAPDVSCARVLELGSASGGNIIPLAARFPRASFTGIDLSRRHIEDGERRIAALNLRNVRVQQADLASLDLTGQEFDYVICHGVFSWVPRSTQDAIFRLCQRAVAPAGIVTISYNVLPGWHLRMVIRDLCLHYAGKQGSPRRRVARARAALQEIATASDATEPYGLLLRTEAGRLLNVPSAYILGEFLAPDNAPCRVGEFVERASEHGFDYLCEVDLCAVVPQTLNPTLRSRLTAFSGPNRPAIEQHIDYLTGRLFRRSVLVRQQSASRPQPMLDPSALSELHISAPVRRDPTQSTGQVSVFLDDRARPITATDPVIGQVLTKLADAFPATCTVNELVPTGDVDQDASMAIEARICQVLFALVLAGRASVSVLPLRVGTAADPWPNAWQVARAEAAAGQPWITSLRHVGVVPQPVLKILMPHLDGTNDRTSLRTHFVAALQEGTIQVPELPADLTSASQQRLNEVGERYVEWVLCYLGRHALLVPATTDAG